MTHSLWNEILSTFRKNGIVVKLIYINVGVFLLESILFVLYFLFTGDRAFVTDLFHEWLALPAHLPKLLVRPWTFVTYMFLHGSLFHLLINMMVLYWFGQIFRQVLGSRKVLPVYIIGGLVGGLFYIGAYNLFPAFKAVVSQKAILVGASAGVMGVLVAAAYAVPNYSLYLLLFGPVKIKYIALFLVGTDLFYGIASRNAGGSFAHLGGAFMGFLFVYQLRQGNDWTIKVNKIFDKIGNLFSSGSSNIKVEYKNPKAGAARYQYKDKEHSKQERIDAILDKIAQSGYDSLTEEEKEFLFKASKDN